MLLDRVYTGEGLERELEIDEDGPTEEQGIKNLSGTGRWEQLPKTRYIPCTEQLETQRDSPFLCLLG